MYLYLHFLVICNLKDTGNCLDQGFIQEDDIEVTPVKESNFCEMIIDNEEIYNINQVDEVNEIKPKNEFLLKLSHREKEILSMDKIILERKNYSQMMQKISDLSVKSKEMIKYKKFSKKKQKNKKKAI
jgi:hypothetical protein